MGYLEGHGAQPIVGPQSGSGPPKDTTSELNISGKCPFCPVYRKMGYPFSHGQQELQADVEPQREAHQSETL